MDLIQVSVIVQQLSPLSDLLLDQCILTPELLSFCIKYIESSAFEKMKRRCYSTFFLKIKAIMIKNKLNESIYSSLISLLLAIAFRRPIRRIGLIDDLIMSMQQGGIERLIEEDLRTISSLNGMAYEKDYESFENTLLLYSLLAGNLFGKMSLVMFVEGKLKKNVEQSLWV
jgi:hypothetical protein